VCLLLGATNTQDQETGTGDGTGLPHRSSSVMFLYTARCRGMGSV
jgi:hypothetical protein